jgi:hypothetical protein
VRSSESRSWVETAASQVLSDPVSPPLLELALVLGELARVAGVVQEAGVLELGDGVVDRVRGNVLAPQAFAQLGDGEIAAGDRLVGQIDRPIALCASHTASFGLFTGFPAAP